MIQPALEKKITIIEMEKEIIDTFYNMMIISALQENYSVDKIRNKYILHRMIKNILQDLCSEDHIYTTNNTIITKENVPNKFNGLFNALFELKDFIKRYGHNSFYVENKLNMILINIENEKESYDDHVKHFTKLYSSIVN